MAAPNQYLLTNHWKPYLKCCAHGTGGARAPNARGGTRRAKPGRGRRCRAGRNANPRRRCKNRYFNFTKRRAGESGSNGSREGLRARKNPREASMQPPGSRDETSRRSDTNILHTPILHTNFFPSIVCREADDSWTSNILNPPYINHKTKLRTSRNKHRNFSLKFNGNSAMITRIIRDTPCTDHQPFCFGHWSHATSLRLRRRKKHLEPWQMIDQSGTG